MISTGFQPILSTMPSEKEEEGKERRNSVVIVIQHVVTVTKILN